MLVLHIHPGSHPVCRAITLTAIILAKVVGKKDSITVGLSSLGNRRDQQLKIINKIFQIRKKRTGARWHSMNCEFHNTYVAVRVVYWQSGTGVYLLMESLMK